MAQYATVQDLRDTGLPPEALSNIDGRELCKFLERAGDLIDTFLRVHNTLPIAGTLSPTNTYPGELIRCNVIIAAYDLLVWRGFQPDQIDDTWRERFEDCMAWLEKVAKGSVSLGDVDATPGTREGAPRVRNNAAGTIHRDPDGELRGW